MINVSENVSVSSPSWWVPGISPALRLASGAAHSSVMRRTCAAFSVEGGISAADSSHRSTCDSDETHQEVGGRPRNKTKTGNGFTAARDLSSVCPIMDESEGNAFLWRSAVKVK